MRITGSHRIAAPREDVWKALQDPAVLARTLPGCQQLEVVGPDRYAATLHAGVASIKGTYSGEVELADKQAPERYVMKAKGAGGPGTIQADATVQLHDDGDGTRLEYDADAIVGGTIAGVGQRMLVGVAKRTAGEFFDAVERELVEGPEPRAEEAAAPQEAAEREGAGASVGQVFQGRAPAAASGGDLKLLFAALAGAAIALVGVWIGRRTASRDR